MLSALLHLIFPNNCLACGNEVSHQLKDICLKCRNELPLYSENSSKENRLKKMFWGKIELEKASAFLKFEKYGKVQELIHQLKYEGKKELGITLGQLAAEKLKKDAFFNGIDYLVPVPIHPLKEKVRGYNQSQYIAEGIQQTSDVPLNKELIIKQIHRPSQTKKNRFQRWKNVSSTFQLQNTKGMEGKHFLLVDDVLTTGSTIEACALELQKIEQVKISLLAMAYTY